MRTLVLILACVAAIVYAQPSLKPHPRLLILDEDIPVILKTISIDPVVGAWYTRLVEYGDSLLGTTPTQWVSGRMLSQSRQVLSRVTTLAGLFRLTSNTAYANRAIEEMVAAAKMPGWCPNSFLDPSEMTNALAIGYDWLYDLLSDTDKALISSAIFNQGLKYGVEFYVGNYTNDPALAPTPLYPSGFDWSTVFFNWNQVCNGGMLMGALAVWENYPSVGEFILNSSIPSIEISISAYAPDGGWVESPTYGIYASTYAAYYIGALQSVFGHDFGIVERHPYLGAYGNFHIHTITPGIMYDSWGDSGLTAGPDQSMVFYGHLFNNTQYIAYERTFFSNSSVSSGISIFHVLWSQPTDINTYFNFMQNTTAFFQGAGIVTTRKNWEPVVNGSTYYAAIKGGNTTMTLNPHQHLDLGNFVVEVDGLQVITDLGADNYSLPGYFNVSSRFSYYLTSSIGHNVFTVNGQSNQQMTTANVDYYQYTPNVYTNAHVDLTSAYAPNLTSAIRELNVDLSYNTIQIYDTVVPNNNTKDITWRFHSNTVITVDNKPTYNPVITFTQGSKSVQAVLLLPDDTNNTITAYPYSPTPPEYQTPNLHVLEVRVTGITSEISVALTFML